VLLPRAFLAAWLLGGDEDRDLGPCKRQEAHILPPRALGRSGMAHRGVQERPACGPLCRVARRVRSLVVRQDSPVHQHGERRPPPWQGRAQGTPAPRPAPGRAAGRPPLAGVHPTPCVRARGVL
jgi:hypothetical protein